MTHEPGSPPPRERTRGALDAEPRLSWLLRRKVTVPDRVEGHVDRERLVLRAMPTRNRLTVLMAPGGFGKTTLLAVGVSLLGDALTEALDPRRNGR